MASLIGLPRLDLTFNILVILTGLIALGTGLGLLATVLPLVALEVVGELVVLCLLLLLQIISLEPFTLRVGKTRQLLLRLRNPNAWLLTARTHAGNSDLLTVSILVVLDRQLGFDDELFLPDFIVGLVLTKGLLPRRAIIRRQIAKKYPPDDRP